MDRIVARIMVRIMARILGVPLARSSSPGHPKMPHRGRVQFHSKPG
jgi:hypothetical protein